MRYENSPGGRESSVYASPIPYSTDTVTFMALGDGSVSIVNDTDPHLLYSGSGWQKYENSSLIDGSLHATSAAGDSVEFKFKGSAVEVYGSKGLDGAVMEVWLDDQRLDDIDLFDSVSSVFGANAKRSQRFVIATGLDPNVTHTLVLKHSGTKNPSAASPAYINIEAISFDGYFEDSTGLAREIRSQVSVFEAPEVYNTSLNTPYVISLLHPPLKAGTEKVFYRDSQLTKAAEN
ncbi:MAG: hypothetical protein H5U03_07985, partial [Clostridia bacterium]|nr:hypothetical protein [Clostridia bacterium]